MSKRVNVDLGLVPLIVTSDMKLCQRVVKVINRVVISV